MYTVGHINLAASTGTTILISYLEMKSLQLIWTSGARRLYLRVSDPQISCRDLTAWEDTMMVAHYSDVIMDVMASQITSLNIVYSTFYSGADQRKHQSSASLAFVWGIHQWPVNSLHKWAVMRKIFLFDDVIMPRNFCRTTFPFMKWSME